MRWTQTADRRDELMPLELQWVLLKEERLEMHSTHHNQLKVSSYIYAQKKGVVGKWGRGGGCYHFTTVEMKANKLRRLQKKKTQSDLVAAPNVQNLVVGDKPDWTGLGSTNAPFSTGSSFTWLRDLTLIRNPSTGVGGWGWGVDMISCLSVQHSHSYILLYNWSLRSTESYHGHVIPHLDFNL